MNADAVQLLINANAESNKAALTDMAQVLATSLKEKSADDQARFEAMMEKMQNRIDQQDATMTAVLEHLGRTNQPEGSLSAKDTPDVDEFKHSALADKDAQSDYLVTFAQLCANMQATGKLTAQTDYRKWVNSAAGKREFKTAVTDKGITDDVGIAAHMSQVRNRFNTDVTTVYSEHLFIHPDEVTAPTPDDADGHHASKKKFRDVDYPFDSIDYRASADTYLYTLLVKTFKAADWQLRFQQKFGDDNRGAACLALLNAEFDPKNLSTAIVATFAFLNASYTATSLEKHCNEMRSQFLKIKAMYFDKSKRKPDWEKMAHELCATAFIKSLPDDVAKPLQEAMNKLDRKFYTFEKCMETALEHTRNFSVSANDRQFSAFVAPTFTPVTFAAFLTGSITTRAGLMCTNCGMIGHHQRKECPKKCRIPLPGGNRGDCNGIAPNHNPLCMLHPTNVQARREAAKREREAKRTDRRGANPPPAYARQRGRKFPPKVQQQAHANLVNLQGVKAQIMSSLVAATDQPAREFYQQQLVSTDQEIANCNLVIQQVAEEEAMHIASANLSKLVDSDSDYDFEDRACFDDLVKLDDVTDDAQPARSTKSTHGQHARSHGTSAWFVPDRTKPTRESHWRVEQAGVRCISKAQGPT